MDIGENNFEIMAYLHLIQFITLGIAVLTVIKYYFKFQFFKKRGQAFPNESFYGHPIFLQFILEMLAVLIHPSPFLHGLSYTSYNHEIRIYVRYYYNDLLIIFVIVRLNYYIFEVFKSSKYNSTRLQRINLLFNNENLSVFLPLKNYIANHPIKFMLLSLFLSMTFFSALIITVERPVSAVSDRNLDEWGEVIWFVVVTMTTIGYGDRVVKTLAARLIVMFLVIWGNFWSSIFLSSIFPYLQLALPETKAFNTFNRLKLRNKLKAKSEELLFLIVKMKYTIKHKKLSDAKIDAINVKAALLLCEIRDLKKKFNKTMAETNYFIDDILRRVERTSEVTQDELVKCEKIYQNVEQILNYLSKAAKLSVAKLGGKDTKANMQIEIIKKRFINSAYKSKLRVKDTKSFEKSDIDKEMYILNNINQMDEESLKEYKTMFKDIKKTMIKSEAAGLDFSEDLHRYLADYLENYQDEEKNKFQKPKK